MSLILEALRKSEAERRRGQAPDVLADMPQAAPAQRSALPLRAWLPVLVALALVAAAWLLLREPTASVAPAATGTTTTSTPAPPVLPKIERLQPASEPVQDGPVTTPAAAAGAPSQATAATVGVPPAVANARATAPVPIEPSGPPASTAPAPAPVPAPASAPEAADDAGIAKATPAPAIQPTPVPPAERNAAARPPAESFADLGFAERQALPPLQLSMHMWNDDPARRFVILDGQRVGQGDRIGDAVVEAITRDGVIMGWRGRRLKIPLP